MEFINYKYNKEIMFYYKNKPSNLLIEIVVDCFNNNNNNTFKLIKKGKGRRVFKISLQNTNYYLKEYNYTDTEKIIKNILRKSAAYRSLKITHKLLNNNIPVVKPVLAAVFKENFYKQKSIFITKDFGGENLQEFIAFGNYTKKVKQSILIEVAKIWAKLYENNFFNADPNLASILVNFNKYEKKIALVDVDDIKYSILLTKKKILNNLVDLNAHSYSGLGNLSNQRLTHNDRLIFLNKFIDFYTKKNFNKSEMKTYIKNNTYNLLDDWDKLGFLKK